MIRLELLAFGRFLRLRLSPAWRWWFACCGGVLVAEAGPLAVQLYTRRMYWERP